jgi:hypothetical protein
MPQKTIFTKYPLLSVPHSFLSCGLIRTDDPRIIRLYQKAPAFLESPSVWEGVFRLAALVTDNPVSEPVTGRILAALSENEDGSFHGSLEEQTAVARAGMALFEYNTDRSILKRIAAWCRYLEVEWDPLLSAGKTIFCPADLMELLVRFYRISGIRSVLRLCTKLRSAAFDWTTALHTIQQVMPTESSEDSAIAFIERISAAELDYDQKQLLLNHAETLAGGIRYSLYAGIFSGNRQDLTAGRTAWNYLQKHYRAICGGTTSGPFLSGAGSDAEVSTAALAAWTEAFASQMLLPDSEWATDELVRIVFNGLAFCLNRETIPARQRVNAVTGGEETGETAGLYAKVTRAAAAAFSHWITVTETGIRINYPIRNRSLLMIRKQALLLQGDRDSVRFSCKTEMTIPAEIFRARTETAEITVDNGEDGYLLSDEPSGTGRTGRYLRIGEMRCDRTGIRFGDGDGITAESAHHQGVCWFMRNRLMAFECGKNDYAVAAAETPELRNGSVQAVLYRIDGWHLHHEEPDDIPVLPARFEEQQTVTLVPYDSVKTKISLFPRINPLCLK